MSTEYRRVLTDLNTLRAIEQHDPDGWSDTQPTPAMYLQFRASVIDRYGRQAWNDYNRGGWAPTPEA